MRRFMGMTLFLFLLAGLTVVVTAGGDEFFTNLGEVDEIDAEMAAERRTSASGEHQPAPKPIPPNKYVAVVSNMEDMEQLLLATTAQGIHSFVLFTTGDCGSDCDHVLEQFYELAMYWREHKASTSKVIFATVDVNQSEELAIRFHVTYLPALFVFREGLPRQYMGQRIAERMLQFLQSLTIPATRTIETKNQRKDFLAYEKVRVVGYFEDLTSVEAGQFEGAARYFQQSIPFYAVSDEKLAQSLKLQSSPSVAIYKPAERTIKYEETDRFTRESIIEFVLLHKRPLWDEMRYDNLHGAWEMDKPTCLAFLDDSKASNKLESTFKALAKHFGASGQLGFLTLDTKEYSEVLPSYNLTEDDVPTLAVIKLTRHNAVQEFLDKDKTEISERALIKWIEKVLEGFREDIEGQSSDKPIVYMDGPTVALTRNTFEHQVLQAAEPALVQFYTPWCAACKDLVPVYNQVAYYFATKEDTDVMIATYDCSTEDPPEQCDTRNLPAIVFFPSGKYLKKERSVFYPGTSKTKNSIIDFVEQHLLPAPGANANNNKEQIIHEEL